MKKRLKDIPKIRQHYKYDCGAACLSAVASWYGVNVPLAKIREYCGCTEEGITIKGILEGACELGLKGKAYKSAGKEIDELKHLNCPVIAHITEDDGMLHFILVNKVGKDWIKIMDPAEGNVSKVPRGEFLRKWNGIIIVLVPGDDFVARNEKIRFVPLFIKLMRSHISEYWLVLAGSATLVIAGICNSVFIQQIIDRGIRGENMHIILQIGAVLAALALLSLCVQYFRCLFMLRLGIKLGSRLIVSYFRKLFRLPLRFFSEYQTGDLSSRISDALKIRIILCEGSISLTVSLITLIGSVSVMFWYQAKIAIFITLYIPLYLGLFCISRRINRKYSKKIAVSGARFDSRLINQLKAVHSIKYNNAEPVATETIEQSYVDLADAIYRGGKASATFETCSDGLSRTLITSVLIIGGIFSVSGSITAGELVSFYTLCGFFTMPLNNIIAMSNEFADSQVALERLFEILSFPEEDEITYRREENDRDCTPYLTEHNGSTDGITEKQARYRITCSRKGNDIEALLKPCNGEIRIKDLSFSYRGSEQLFSNLNITFKKGKITLLTGRSGCGKSTLISLISKDLIPAGGSIAIGEKDIANITHRDLRDLITVVPQQPHLMDSTLFDNICCGKGDDCGVQPEKGETGNGVIEKIYGICGRLNLNELINSLPMGLFTNIVGTGRRISGGEAQRLAIARALFRETGIYIFDEPTAWLDRESEILILEEIVRLRKNGKTIIVVSHTPEDSINTELSAIADDIKDLNKIKKNSAHYCRRNLHA